MKDLEQNPDKVLLTWDCKDLVEKFSDRKDLEIVFTKREGKIICELQPQNPVVIDKTYQVGFTTTEVILLHIAQLILWVIIFIITYRFLKKKRKKTR